MDTISRRINILSWSALSGVPLMLFALAAPASAALQALPHLVNVVGDGISLSSDGKVAVLTNSLTTKLYLWNETSGTRDFGEPADSLGWVTDAVTLNQDGSVVTGEGYFDTDDWKPGLKTAWTWDVGVKIGYYARKNYDTRILGISPDGTFRVRLETSQLGAGGVINRVYALGVVPWVNLTAQDVVRRVTADASTLVGESYLGTSSYHLPTCWRSSGAKVQATALIGPDYAVALYASKDGRIVAGGKHHVITGSSTVATGYTWNTITNQVSLYQFPGWLDTYPYYLSPDGNIVEISESNPTAYNLVIVDSTTPADAARGPQLLSSWLVAKNYISSTDAENRTFSIEGISDDQTTVAGNYSNAGSTAQHGFIAHRQ